MLSEATGWSCHGSSQTTMKIDMALFIVYRLYPLLTSEWGIIEAQFYVCCTVGYFTYSTRLPRTSIVTVAFLPAPDYLSSHVTYNWRLRGQLFLPEILLTGHLPVQFITCAHSLLWLCYPHPDPDQCSRLRLHHLPRRSAIHTTIIINRLTVQCLIWLIWYHYYCFSLVILTRNYFSNMCMHSFSIF